MQPDRKSAFKEFALKLVCVGVDIDVYSGSSAMHGEPGELHVEGGRDVSKE